MRTSWPLVGALFLGALGYAACAADAEGPEDEPPVGLGGTVPIDGGGGTSGTGGTGVTGGTGGTGVTGGTGGGGTGGAGAQGPDATVVVGAPDRVLFVGTVVTPDTSYQGRVLVEGDTISCAAPGLTCADAAGAQGATIIETNGIIAPGFIDTHNHIIFDIFDNDDWVPQLPPTCSAPSECETSNYCSGGKCDCVDNVCRYKNHNQWPDEAEYQQMLDYKQCMEDASQGKPIWCPQTYDGEPGRLKCEMDKFGELKGMISGTTAIVGLPGTSAACFGSLSRSIDVSQNDLPDDKVQTSALFPPSGSSGDGVCANYSDGDTEAYLVHNGEGLDDTARGEFATLGTFTTTDGCLYAPQTAITHGTAYTATEYDVMAQAGMKLTWSPQSNVSLYGNTNDLPLALDRGILISLAPDWSMGGSPNMLREMQFAAMWDDTHYQNRLTSQDIVTMATANAAAVLSLANTLGRVEPGFKADLVVLGGDVSVPFDATIAQTPATVRAVMIGGVILYGDDQLKPAAPQQPGCEDIDICGVPKFLCVAEATTDNKLGQTFQDISNALNSAFQDLDTIQPLPASSCNPGCGADEECYDRTLFAQVPASNCPSACGAGEACYQRYQSGSNQFQCLTTTDCSPRRTRTFHPLPPLAICN